MSTQLTRLAAQLGEVMWHLESLLKLSEDLILIGDHERILLASPSWETHLGYSPTEVCSWTFPWPIVPGGDVDEHLAVLGAVLEGKTHPVELRYHTKSGRTLLVEFRGSTRSGYFYAIGRILGLQSD